jgi:TolA-binding protein
MGEIYYNLESYEQAIISFHATIDNYPLSTWPDETRLIAPLAYFYLGFCNEKLEKWEEAIAAYQVIIDEYPTSTWDNGDSIAEDAQERIDFIIENYLPPEESPSDE